MAGYRVDIEERGRWGTVRYYEQGKPLEFWWEFTGDGAAIRVPAPQEWDAFCAETAAWATGRREQIVRRVAEQTRRQRAPASTVELEDEWIVLRF